MQDFIFGLQSRISRSDKNSWQQTHWELEIQDRYYRTGYGWLLSDTNTIIITVDDFFSIRLLKNLHIENRSSRLSNIAFYVRLFWLQTLVAIMPEIVCKLLRAAIWSGYAVQLNLSRRLFLAQVVNLDLLLCAGPLRIQWGTWGFVWKLFLAFGSDFQMTGRGSNLDWNLNSAAWPTSCLRSGFCLLQNLWINCVEFDFFLGPFKMPMLRPAVKRFQPSSLRMGCWPALTCQSSFLQIRKGAVDYITQFYEGIFLIYLPLLSSTSWSNQTLFLGTNLLDTCLL